MQGPGSMAPPQAPTGPSCPACGRTLQLSDRFCPSCGAPIGTPAPQGPPTTQAPPTMDIRSRVEQDRGALKKLQLLIPGFRAYRLGEDVRVADSILRLQVADRLVIAMQRVDSLRSDMARAGVVAGLTDIGSLRSEMQRLEGQIRHAEQGYTGISPALRLNPEKLDRLYERDWSFLSAAENVVGSVAPIGAAVVAHDGVKVTTLVGQLRDSMKSLENTFSQRILDVEKVLQ